jgi:hypothetical protein
MVSTGCATTAPISATTIIDNPASKTRTSLERRHPGAQAKITKPEEL